MLLVGLVFCAPVEAERRSDNRGGELSLVAWMSRDSYVNFQPNVTF